MKIIWTAGADLTPEQRAAALRSYPYRYTGDHTPCWVRPLSFVDPEGRNPSGTWQYVGPKPVPHYVCDLSWIRSHVFPVIADAAGFTSYKFATSKQLRRLR